jgi:hypothetical protein
MIGTVSTGQGFLNKVNCSIDHPSEIVALQVAGDWSNVLNRLTVLRQQNLSLLGEANRAICLFHLHRFEEAAALAPGLTRIYLREVIEYEVNRLMMSLIVLAMVAHHRTGNSAEARRFALELCHHFDWRAGDLPLIPSAILRNNDGTLTIHETSNGRVIVFVLLCLSPISEKYLRRSAERNR